MKNESSGPIIIDGKALAEKKYRAIKKNADIVFAKLGRKPKLNVILASAGDASKIYVGTKLKKGSEIGVDVVLHTFSATSSTTEILDLISKINLSKNDDGIILQQPVFPNLDNERILSSIDPTKDVDGFTIQNLGMILRGVEPYFYPCTPKGILDLLDEAKYLISGKNVVIIGRSNIVGKPVALMLLQRNATVSILHSKTIDIPSYCKGADILISAVGRPNFVKGDWIRSGAFVIDVGVNRVGGKICGDVDFQSAQERAGYITPVPGGVGPMTVANLLENTVLSAMRVAGIAKDL